MSMEQIGNLRKVNHRELQEYILKYYNARLSLMTWGTIGIGKSDKIKETAQKLAEQFKLPFSDNVVDSKKFSFMDVRLATMDATDIKGIPFPFKVCTKCDNHLKMDDTKCKCGCDALTVATVWLLPDWFPRDPKSKGVLLFDEITNATPMVQHSAYTIIRDRKIGKYLLPEGWMVISAGNRVEDMSNVYEMSKALENRYGHAELQVPSIKDWTEWAITHNVNKYVIAYLNWQPTKLMMFRPSEQSRTELKEKAFATPRTWEYASRLIDGVTDVDMIEGLTATAVGNAIGMDFSAFLQLRTKLELEEIIKNPERIKELEGKTDLLWVAITQISDWYKDHTDKKYVQRICQIAEHLRGEFAILLLRYCKREHEKNFVQTIKEIPEWKNNLSQKYAPYVL